MSPVVVYSACTPAIGVAQSIPLETTSPDGTNCSFKKPEQRYAVRSGANQLK